MSESETREITDADVAAYAAMRLGEAERSFAYWLDDLRATLAEPVESLIAAEHTVIDDDGDEYVCEAPITRLVADAGVIDHYRRTALRWRGITAVAELRAARDRALAELLRLRVSDREDHWEMENLRLFLLTSEDDAISYWRDDE